MAIIELKYSFLLEKIKKIKIHTKIKATENNSSSFNFNINNFEDLQFFYLSELQNVNVILELDQTFQLQL